MSLDANQVAAMFLGALIGVGTALALLLLAWAAYNLLWWLVSIPYNLRRRAEAARRAEQARLARAEAIERDAQAWLDSGRLPAGTTRTDVLAFVDRQWSNRPGDVDGLIQELVNGDLDEAHLPWAHGHGKPLDPDDRSRRAVPGAQSHLATGRHLRRDELHGALDLHEAAVDARDHAVRGPVPCVQERHPDVAGRVGVLVGPRLTAERHPRRPGAVTVADPQDDPCAERGDERREPCRHDTPGACIHIDSSAPGQRALAGAADIGGDAAGTRSPGAPSAEAAGDAACVDSSARRVTETGDT